MINTNVVCNSKWKIPRRKSNFHFSWNQYLHPSIQSSLQYKLIFTQLAKCHSVHVAAPRGHIYHLKVSCFPHIGYIRHTNIRAQAVGSVNIRNPIATNISIWQPIPLAARTKTWVCAAARLLGLQLRVPPTVWMSVCCECCQVEGSASGWSLVQRSPTGCGVSECDRDASKMWWPGPLGAVAPKKMKFPLTSAFRF